MLVTVNNRLKFEIEIVHDLSCHPIFSATVHNQRFAQVMINESEYNGRSHCTINTLIILRNPAFWRDVLRSVTRQFGKTLT